MRTIAVILRKEFLQIFRNRAMLPIIFIAPIIQLLILAFAASYEVKNISLAVVDQDLSYSSRLLVNKMKASGYFNIDDVSFSQKRAFRELNADRADIILEIPPDFERDLVKYNRASLQLSANAINNMKATLGTGYASSIIVDFNKMIRVQYGQPSQPPGQGTLEILPIPWFNPTLNYRFFMVPGILVILVTLIGSFLSGMNIVREKEIGTIEQLNVTPIRKIHFIIGKLLPFWFIGLFELAFGLGVGVLVFHVPVHGNIWIVFVFAAVYLPLVLGIGLLISTFADTQQQAMFLAWFFLVIFILMSGLFTAVENMPDWAQKINFINPLAYFIEVIRRVMLKGSGFADISQQFLIVLAYGILINVLAVLNYRKVSA